MSLAPGRDAYKAPRTVRVDDFDTARFEAMSQRVRGHGLSAEERRFIVQQALTKRISVPDFDVNDVGEVLQADIDDPFTRGRIYHVRRATVMGLPLDSGEATCPKCKELVAVAALLPVVPYHLRIPNFKGCECREEDGEPDEMCTICDGKGWIISSWTDAEAYLACEVCVARERQPTRRGSATNFTTTSRAGEEGGRKAQKARAMCTTCQMRYAVKKAQAVDGVPAQTCKTCANEYLRRKQRQVAEELQKVREELVRLKEGAQ